MSDSEDDDFELYDTFRYYEKPKERSLRETSYVYDDGIGKLYEQLVGRDRLRTEDEFSDEADDVLDDSFDKEIYSDQLVTSQSHAEGAWENWKLGLEIRMTDRSIGVYDPSGMEIIFFSSSAEYPVMRHEISNLIVSN